MFISSRKIADRVALSGYFVVVPDFIHRDPYQPDNPNNPGMWVQAHNPVCSLFSFFDTFLFKVLRYLLWYFDWNCFWKCVLLQCHNVPSQSRSTFFQTLPSVKYVEIIEKPSVQAWKVSQREFWHRWAFELLLIWWYEVTEASLNKGHWRFLSSTWNTV